MLRNYRKLTVSVSSVFLTSAIDLPVSPLIALSHFLLLSPDCSLSEASATGLSFLSKSATSCSSSVSVGPFFSGRICGKNNTYWIELLLVNSMVRRSMPMPIPEVGGIPYSKERRKSWSINIASSSPFSERDI